MKKALLISSILFLLVKASFGQIPNADFSSWFTDSVGRLDPVGWESSNTTSANHLIHQDTDRTGMTGYSVRFTSDYDSTFGFFLGGRLLQDSVPFSSVTRPYTIQGYYKMSDQFGNNAITVGIRLYSSTGVLVGWKDVGVPLMGGMVPSWTAFMDSIDYLTNDPIAYYSVDLFLMQINGQAPIGAHLDDISFDGITAIVPFNEIRPFKVISESENSYVIRMDENKEFKTELYNINGERLYCESEIIASGRRINLTGLASGVYICKIHSGNNIYPIRLLKN